MKKQLFLSVVLLVLSAEMFAPMGGAGTGGSRRNTGGAGAGAGAGTGGGKTITPSTAQKAAQGLSAAEAVASAMEALGVTAEEVAAASSNSAAVNFIQSGK